MLCLLAFVLRQLMRMKLDKLGWQGSFAGPLATLGRVRATVPRGNGGQTFRLRARSPVLRCLPSTSSGCGRHRLERLGWSRIACGAASILHKVVIAFCPTLFPVTLSKSGLKVSGSRVAF